jgi:poly(A) polymerase
MTLPIERIPFNKEIKRIASDNNITVFFVGGTVRDLLLNRHIHDVDIVVFGIEYTTFAFKLKQLLKAHSINFKDNVRIVKDNVIIDISKPRGNSIDEDLKLRDFTINSMALSLRGNLINYTNDLQNRIINIQYDGAFIDDPLRMLRAFRLSSELDFTINKTTLDKINQYKLSILNIAKERIYEELFKTFTAKYFKNTYSLFIDAQLFNILFNINFDDSATKLVKNCLNIYLSNYFYSSSTNRFIHIMVLFVIYQYILGDCSNKVNIKNSLRKLIIVKNIYTSISKILQLLETLLKMHLTKNRLYHIILNNLDFISDILILLDILSKSYLTVFKKKDLYNMLKIAYNDLKIEKIKEINGHDIKKIGINEGLLFGKLLKRAQFYLALGKCHTKEESLQRIKKLWERINEIS